MNNNVVSGPWPVITNMAVDALTVPQPFANSAYPDLYPEFALSNDYNSIQAQNDSLRKMGSVIGWGAAIVGVMVGYNFLK